MSKKIKSILDNTGYKLYLDNLSKEELKTLDKVKKILTVKPNISNDYSSSSDDMSFEVFKSTSTPNNIITLPRYIGYKYFGEPSKNLLLDLNILPINIKTTFVLRDYQQAAVDKCLPIMRELGGGIMSLYCGAGKTRIAIYLASVLKVKTLIIV